MPFDHNMELGKRVIAAFNAAGIDYRSFSGRGMYGKSCIGAYASVWEVAVALAGSDEGSDLLEDVGEPSTDSMGRGTMVYWPRLKWDDSFSGSTEDEDDEDEEED